MGISLLKKGDIELSKIVTFIIVAVVLIVAVAFFLGGSTSITKAIKGVFFGVTAGTDKGLAIENCKQYCAQAQGFLDVETKQNSPYCTYYVKIDNDNDGEADYKQTGGVKMYDRWYCSQNHRTTTGDEQASINDLHVPCDLGSVGGNSITCTSP